MNTMMRAGTSSLNICCSHFIRKKPLLLTATAGLATKATTASAASVASTFYDALCNVSETHADSDVDKDNDSNARSGNESRLTKKEKIKKLRQKTTEMTTKPLPLDESNLHALAAALRDRENAPSLTFLLGGPGSGKGTLSDMITSQTKARHVSVGALLRELTSRRDGNIANEAEARRISAEMSRGGVLSADLATRILLRHLYHSELFSDQEGERFYWLVDGFPRSFANAVLLDTLRIKPTAVIALEVDDATMRRRLARRARRDDLDYIIDRRFTQFRFEWESIKEFYKRRNLLVEIDADGTPKQVWQRYLDAMEPFNSPLPQF